MIRFNTGRHYTREGQRIAAKITDDGGIFFVDVDRMVDGFVEPETVKTLQLTLTARDVLWAYDNHDKSLCHRNNGRRWKNPSETRELEHFAYTVNETCAFCPEPATTYRPPAGELGKPDITFLCKECDAHYGG